MADRRIASPRELVPLTRRVTDAALQLAQPLSEEPEFMHAVLCQVGLPRSEVKEREFTRSTGGASMLIEAGKWFDGMRYHDMPLPYGTRPRLVLFHVCSEAVRKKSPEVEVERSASAFLERLGIKKSGESFAAFKKQMLALAACRMQIGYQTDSKVVNLKCDPIQRFDAWTQSDNGQLGLWPGVIRLSNEFFETLSEHAVPLDPRAIAALQNSALALDTYTWLAHRLWRIKQPKGVTLYWRNLKDQFGQEYRSDKDFKREFAGALRKAYAVYPEARIEIVRGGVRLMSSPPPVKRKQVVVAIPPLPPAALPRAEDTSPMDARETDDVTFLDFTRSLAPETLETAKQRVGENFDKCALSFGRMLHSLKRRPTNLDERFLSYIRNFDSAPRPHVAAEHPQTNLNLAPSTIDRAAAEAPGWDIAELEKIWRNWIASRGIQPDKPDAAFLGFVRTHIKRKGSTKA